jgi:hypothetical protein
MPEVPHAVFRFLWNLLFLYTGYKFVMVLNFSIQLAIYAALRFTVTSIGGYLACIVAVGCCMGGFLVMTPTVVQAIFGQLFGSQAYGLFWTCFGLANLTQYLFVNYLEFSITFNGIIYLCMVMLFVAGLVVVFGNFQAPWKNPQDHMGYCVTFAKRKEDEVGITKT